ncbi:MAG: carboxypeptidase-like regulatory domain-containing protein, partial [Bacteroidota bacterium]
MTSNRFITLILLLLAQLSVSLGQNAVLSGKITDGEEALVGASVYLQEQLNLGTTSDLNGEFRLNSISPGTYTIIFTYIGYEKASRQVELKAGEENRIEVVMVPTGFTGEEVVISAQRRGQTQAINQQLSSDKIANIVSADRIQELPDVNAAEAIGRLPGVALSRSGGEGQKVVIRGLEPKFSAITINGVRLPSNSGTDRSVDLSLIAPELLDGIEVFKSPLPDMDAEAIGGTVNLRIKKAPERRKILVRGLGGYNDLANQFRDYKGVVQLSQRFFQKKLGVIAQASAERFNRSGDFLTYSWRQGRTDSMGNTEILGNRLQTEARQEVRRRYNASLALDYDVNPKNRFSFFGVYSFTGRDQFRNNQIFDPSEPSIRYTGRSVEGDLSLYQLSLFAEHDLGPLRIDWSISQSQTIGKTPFDYQMNFFDNVNVFDPAL